ncbi:UDP-2,4-diacetamido-2,4,6-trideoxy-beta-L-altropyranose hydrolase [Romboutsia lituseburensis]|uniref:UDP-2,4-diacetamido-2,4, 6-trideoxy-beta-L-altropyranose hydrolase n=1 Tax=Romboutsia lituseburensis TaxID=1537 RepID=UPI00215AE59C|nr:UDP-2,4-diacetamido-2,4,6-trideoxy-beta-L-altropyranose hydrolase [Romboutsia lituseburensis]MCR8744766.1 UDP-2,4-diacetamido-2,4,6-trideoxy-beta-L-altropyranose hydrolase [Romboutsia lituseburensis]
MELIAIRADGSFEKGMGHIIRCISLAKEFRNKNIVPIFVIKEDKITEEVLKTNKIDYITLKSGNLENEIKEIENIFKYINPKYTLTDSYWMSEKYLIKLKYISNILISVDDNNLYNYPSDIIINYNLHSKDLNYKLKNSKSKILLGCKYCMLRSEFQEKIPININNIVRKILIIMGGTDINSFSSVALDSLLKIDMNLKIDVIVANSYKCVTALREIQSKNNNVNLIFNPNNVADVMKNCDLAISAGGTTIYELGCLGIPTILVPQVDNQINSAKKANDLGMMINLGKYNCVNLYELNDTIIMLSNNKKIRQNMHNICLQYVDKNGNKNIVNEIIEYKISRSAVYEN